jgi:hypothetical protein
MSILFLRYHASCALNRRLAQGRSIIGVDMGAGGPPSLVVCLFREDDFFAASRLARDPNMLAARTAQQQ